MKKLWGHVSVLHNRLTNVTICSYTLYTNRLLYLLLRWRFHNSFVLKCGLVHFQVKMHLIQSFKHTAIAIIVNGPHALSLFWDKTMFIHHRWRHQSTDMWQIAGGGEETQWNHTACLYVFLRPYQQYYWGLCWMFVHFKWITSLYKTNECEICCFATSMTAHLCTVSCGQFVTLVPLLLKFDAWPQNFVTLV